MNPWRVLPSSFTGESPEEVNYMRIHRTVFTGRISRWLDRGLLRGLHCKIPRGFLKNITIAVHKKVSRGFHPWQNLQRIKLENSLRKHRRILEEFSRCILRGFNRRTIAFHGGIFRGSHRQFLEDAKEKLSENFVEESRRILQENFWTVQQENSGWIHKRVLGELDARTAQQENSSRIPKENP